MPLANIAGRPCGRRYALPNPCLVEAAFATATPDRSAESELGIHLWMRRSNRILAIQSITSSGIRQGSVLQHSGWAHPKRSLDAAACLQLAQVDVSLRISVTFSSAVPRGPIGSWTGLARVCSHRGASCGELGSMSSLMA